MRLLSAFLLLACAPLLLGAGALKPAAKGPQPVLQVAPAEIEATPEFAWNFSVQLIDPFDLGLYSDSSFIRLEDRDPGNTGVSRIQTLPNRPLAAGLESVSGRDSAESSQVLPAAFENGTLQISLYVHRADGAKFRVDSRTVTMVPGATSREHPSAFVTTAGKKVEWVLCRPASEGPSPGLLLVHDHGSNARRLLPFGVQLAARGYTVALASLPGYGLSEGTPESPAMPALGEVLDALRHTAGVDTARVAAWGFGRGATAVSSLAAARGDLKAVVLQSGAYDAATAAGIRAATLVLHGATDKEAPPAQAQAFVAAFPEGRKPESKIVAGGHQLPRSEVQRSVLPFLTAQLGR